MSADRIVARARGVVGTRFRLHGRDPASGLDCVGAVAHAFGGRAVPTGYPLRGGPLAALVEMIERNGLMPVAAAEPGDLLLLAVGPGQLHFAVQVPGGIVHADALLRRVVERPGPPPWPIVGIWRETGE